MKFVYIIYLNNGVGCEGSAMAAFSSKEVADSQCAKMNDEVTRTFGITLKFPLYYVEPLQLDEELL